MSDNGIEGQWRFRSLPDYYTSDQQVLVEQPALWPPSTTKVEQSRCRPCNRSSRAKPSAMDDDFLPKAAVSFIEDLYKAGNVVTEWGPFHHAYVTAVWGSFFSVVSDRGFVMRYVAENTYPEPLDHPLILFPDLFGAAGIVYTYPHTLATRLPRRRDRRAHARRSPVPPGGGQRDGPKTAEQVVELRRHLVYLEIDFEDGCLDGIMSLPGAPGTISVFRNAAPLPGTTVKVSIEPRE